MLTTSTAQYLHPDYLQPLPTTLDAKKSPLALLAQTCSSIGKDTTPSKPIIPPLEKKTDDKNSPSKSPSSTDENKRPLSNGKQHSPNGSSGKRSRDRIPKDIPPLVPIPMSTTEKSGSKSPTRSSASPRENSNNSPNISKSTCSTYREIGRGTTDTDTTTKSGLLTIQATGTTPTAKTTDTSMGITHPGALLHPGYYPHLFGHVPFDPAAINSAYGASLSAHSLASLHAAAALKSGASSPGNPYVAYARVKTATGGSNLVPICRDPYCTTCQMSLHSAQLSTTPCAAGCTECSHHKSLYGLPTSTASGLDRLGLQSQLFAGAGLLPGIPSLTGLQALYPHALTAAPQQSALQHVCNWVSGTEYCGKRFQSPEELLQHLRSHTSTSESVTSLSVLPGLYSFPAATSLSQGLYPPTGSISPNSLRRAYPTSLSPVSATRYHPYSKPGTVPSLSAGTVPPLPLQSLGPYYSPYAALYGSRLGPAVAP